MKKIKMPIFIVSLFIMFFLGSYQAFASTTTQRLAGNDRYETAVEISKYGWDQSDYVVLATGESFPDALCAAPLAKKYNAPILLINSNSLNNIVTNELQRLKVKQVFLIGGQGVISKNIENQLSSLNINFVRYAGIDRYETSIKIAESLGDTSKIVLVTGENFADALSISPIAASENMPIILTEPKVLSDYAKKYISTKNITKSYLIGGTGVLSQDIEKAVPNSERIFGNDRYETNFAIMNKFNASLKFDKIYISTGNNFPDALASSAIASKTSSPLTLASNSILKATSDFINSKISDIDSRVMILGGEQIVPASVVSNVINKRFKVVLDAGHGGYDSGAVGGKLGLQEKDVNLAVTLKVGKILESNNIEVIYTRKTDQVSWPSNELEDLKARVNIANSVNPDYFVCIHANSATPTAHGTETYTYALGTEGEKLANSIQSELISQTGLYNRGVKTAGYYVLKNVVAPSVLVELAFISNENEERLLGSEDFQNKCANAISQGIISSLNK